MAERWDWWIEQVAAFNRMGYAAAGQDDAEELDSTGEEGPAGIHDEDDEPPLAHERAGEHEDPFVQSDEGKDPEQEDAPVQSWIGPAAV